MASPAAKASATALFSFVSLEAATTRASTREVAERVLSEIRASVRCDDINDLLSVITMHHRPPLWRHGRNYMLVSHRMQRGHYLTSSYFCAASGSTMR